MYVFKSTVGFLKRMFILVGNLLVKIIHVIQANILYNTNFIQRITY